MISKELLSEVLGYKCNPQFTKVALARGELAYYANSDNTMTKANFINIYELAHKCKEWAFEFNYNLCSSKRKNGSWECWTVFDDNSDNLIGYFESDSEPEAIFQACQWILDNKEQK